MTAWTDEAQGPLFLHSVGVPFWALGRVFGRGWMFWYRLELGLGRNSIVGTTVRRSVLPEHLLADEHHQSRDGVKADIATTVGTGCCLGRRSMPRPERADAAPASVSRKQQRPSRARLWTARKVRCLSARVVVSIRCSSSPSWISRRAELASDRSPAGFPV